MKNKKTREIVKISLPLSLFKNFKKMSKDKMETMSSSGRKAIHEYVLNYLNE